MSSLIQQIAQRQTDRYLSYTSALSAVGVEHRELGAIVNTDNIEPRSAQVINQLRDSLIGMGRQLVASPDRPRRTFDDGLTLG